MFNPQEHVVLGHAESTEAAQQLAQQLGCAYDEIRIHRFPDGESKVTVPTETPGRVILYRSLNQPNDKLIELLLCITTLRENGVQHITLVAPYFCYMRQDIAFEAGEAVSQRIIGEFISRYIDSLITVDAHLHRVHELSAAVPCPRAINLTAASLFRDYLREHIRDAILLGPDEESAQWVASIAEDHYRFGVAYKQRHGDREVDILLPDLSFRDQTVILIDDVLSTGQTLLKTVEALRLYEPERILIMVTHALFAEPDFDQTLYDNGVADIICTDSIPHRSQPLPLAPLIAKAITDGK